VLNVVTASRASEVAAVFTSDIRVRKLSFTGSTRVGALLAAQCAGQIKRLSLELGGNAPFIVFDDAALDEAVQGLIASKFRNAGQTCVCANRVLVQAGVYDDFADRVERAVRALRVGIGESEETDIGPLINGAAVEKVEAHVADAGRNGARITVGGHRHPAGPHFFEPTVLRDVAPTALLCQEETFGPLAGLVRFDTEQQALALANATPFGLAAYIYTQSYRRIVRFSEQLEVGMLAVNSGVISTEVAPFGGVKMSGYGREGSRHGLDEYLDLRYLCLAGLENDGC
jgi:succinate-semialdehyde dehydrogenase/glutarate-semialdehyde dehydrogenase